MAQERMQVHATLCRAARVSGSKLRTSASWTSVKGHKNNSVRLIKKTKTPISVINEATPPSRMLSSHAGIGTSWPWSEPAQGQVLSAGERKKNFKVTSGNPTQKSVL
eukprot:1153115-Pelagomonas_calceolata.AAC.2